MQKVVGLWALPGASDRAPVPEAPTPGQLVAAHQGRPDDAPLSSQRQLLAVPMEATGEVPAEVVSVWEGSVSVGLRSKRPLAP